MISRPGFLVGAERSGTTLLRLMLSHHPQIAWANEFEYSVDKLPENGWPDLDEYLAFLSNVRQFTSQNYEVDRSLSYPELVDSFLEQFRQKRGGKPIVGATVHRHFDRLLRIWPDARFIHILRDGRDVARSRMELGWAGNMWTGVEAWMEVEKTWESLREKLSPDRRTEIRYEHLIADARGELARLCEFLGVNFDEAVFDYTKTTHFKPPDLKRVSSWRTKLRPEEVRLAEAYIGSMLAERGYELSDLPPLEITPAMERQLRRDDYWSRVRHRMKELGPLLFFEGWFARRLGGRRWRARVERQLAVIRHRQNLKN
jgi:hypothetical protein